MLGTQRDNMQDMARKGRAAQGSAHWCAKLNEVDIERIRDLRASGATYRTLGAYFGVSKATIRQVFTGRSWKGVPGTGP